MKKSTDIRTLKKLNKPTRYTIPDTRGLHLWVKSNANKYWIFRFTLNGKRSDMCLGSFPLVTLAEAREKTLHIKREILKNVNPIEERKHFRNALTQEQKPSKSFHIFASEFIEKMSPQWTSNTHESAWIRSIEVYANPIIGQLKISSIKTEHILSILEPIWSLKTVTATRLRGRLEKILSAAISAGFHDGPNPALWSGHLENLLPHIRRNPKHYKALEYQAVPAFLKKIMLSHSVTSLALQFTILNATRANETFQCMKSEIDGDVWTIPAHKMKARRVHHAPLCPRSLSIIQEAISLDPDSPFVFSKRGKPLTHTSMLHFVEAQGINATVHGFRSSFRDWVSDATTVGAIAKQKPRAPENWDRKSASWWHRFWGFPTREHILHIYDTRDPALIDEEEIQLPPRVMHVVDSELAELISSPNLSAEIEIIARRRYWRYLNDSYRETYRHAREIDPAAIPSYEPTLQQRQNMEKLLSLLETHHTKDWIEMAELLRQLGELITAQNSLNFATTNQTDDVSLQSQLIKQGIQAPVRFRH